jgi:CIC family chloride channel protein
VKPTARGWHQRIRLFWQLVKLVAGPHRLRNNEPALIVVCALLGGVVGILVVGMHELVNLLHDIDFGLPMGASLSGAQNIEWRRLALVPALGGLVMGGLAVVGRKFRPRDIVDPVEANAIFGGRMSLVDSLRLAAATMISNGAGASVGMEAAYTQMGSGVLSSVGQTLHLRREDLRVFVAAGAAAAIAAAFNAPLAGAFYAYELVLGIYSTAALAQVAVASLAGTLVMRATLGVAPLFPVDAPPLVIHDWEYPVFAALGVVAGGIGVATMRMVTWWEKQMRSLSTPAWLRPAIGGIVLSGIAVFFPQVLGSGHGAILIHFQAAMPLLPVSLLLLAKMAASAVSIGSGFRGGLFSSSLFLGCLFGATVSQLSILVFPPMASQHMVFMLVGMGAVAAAIIGAPVTMVLLVLELTGDFQVTLGVLAGVVTSATLVRYTFGYSFATWRFHLRGVGIHGAHDIGWLVNLTVGRLMNGDIKTVSPGVPLRRLRELIPLGSRPRVFAVDAAGRYGGIIDVAVIHDADLDDAAEGLVAGDLARAFPAARAERALGPGQLRRMRNGGDAGAGRRGRAADHRLSHGGLRAAPLYRRTGAPAQRRIGRARSVQRRTRSGEQGNVIVTLRPGALSARSMDASCSWATAATRLRPRPLPGVLRLASTRWKRRNTLSRSLGGMPGPSSSTLIRQPPLPSASARRIRQPVGVCLRLFSTRFEIIWTSNSRSPRMRPTPSICASRVWPASTATGS